MKKRNGTFVAICLIGSVLLTELTLVLDLVPILLLIPWQVMAGVAIVFLTIIVIILVILQRRGWKIQFSTRLLLLLGLMVAWPVSRFSLEAKRESNRIVVQQECFEMVNQLKPTGMVGASGRYNDGRSDFSIQRWLIGLISLGVDFNHFRFEVLNLVSLDLKGTEVTDDQLAMIAKTETVQHLDLSSTKITDAGLTHLYELNSLNSLTLTNTNVSTAAIEKLKSKLPRLTVIP